MTTVPYTFGNESSPIPLSQLDANFAVTPQYANTAGNVVNAYQANITSVGTLTALSVSGNINSGNLRTTGSVSATGNVITDGRVSVVGNITGGAFVTAGMVSATGNITGNYILGNGSQLSGIPAAYTNANLATLGSNVISTTGTITGGNVTTTGQISAQGNITAQGIVSATGNIVTAANFVGNFLGNITGNLSVGGANTQVLFNSNGNVGAAGGLTYNSGSNTLSVLGVVSAQGNIYGANLVLSGTGNLNVGGNLIVADSLNVGGNLIVADNLNIGANLVVPGTAQLVGVATAPTAPAGTANNQVATTAFVINNGVPSGCILLWSGSIISVPSGWYLCDGTNGTPNLTNKFIVGAGSTYNVAATGGSANSIVVSHTHTASVNDPGHQHLFGGDDQIGTYGGYNAQSGFSYDATSTGSGGAQNYYTKRVDNTNNPQTTGITVSNSTTGASGTDANLPPYYALAYIMKS
jgi:hypothetical protein